MKDTYDIVVVPGDGIGPEVAASAVEVLNAAFGTESPLRFSESAAGAELFRATGESLPSSTLTACFGADAILHGAAGLPGVVHEDGTEAGLDFTLTLRTSLDLYANVRPILLQPGIRSPLSHGKPIDYVIIRENSEGLYASRGGGIRLGEQLAVDNLVQTRKGVERIVRFAFELARTRQGAPRDGVRRVTCCDKANVLQSYAYFRSIFDEVAKDYPDIEAEYCLIDAMALHLVLRPDHYDVIVTENMFGDIISDLGAATVGGMGMAPSSEVGERAGLFQASHGSAPDIAGKGVANPYGTIMAGVGMLEWLGVKHDDERMRNAALAIRDAVATVYADAGSHTADIGGTARTANVTAAIVAMLDPQGA
jgi:3-isopropylmalate dehydrogenase